MKTEHTRALSKDTLMTKNVVLTLGIRTQAWKKSVDLDQTPGRLIRVYTLCSLPAVNDTSTVPQSRKHTKEINDDLYDYD